ncbi:hypothetical protein Q1695_012013 [Nippostrongylus brasiliensis]|nr:hypothetical protein Q1695_012013 [Nippostrongylus brasiliensis]
MELLIKKNDNKKREAPPEPRVGGKSPRSKRNAVRARTARTDADLVSGVPPTACGYGSAVAGANRCGLSWLGWLVVVERVSGVLLGRSRRSSEGVKQMAGVGQTGFDDGYFREAKALLEPIFPIIGEDVMISEPHQCRPGKRCSHVRLQESLDRMGETVLKSVAAERCSHVRLRESLDRMGDLKVDEFPCEPDWTWEDDFFAPSFDEPSFPSVSMSSKSWEDVFSTNSSAVQGIRFIKEIYVNDRHLQKPEVISDVQTPKIIEPRQKFQRFREKKFICDECDRSFTMKQNVQQHFFQYHNPNGEGRKPLRVRSKRFQCTKCNKIFKTLEKAQRHEARLHGEKASPNVFVCPHCNKIYNAQSQLKEHIDVVHENLRPFKCEQCGMEFGRAGGLRRHDMMVHQQRTHACPYEGCDHPGYKCTKALAAHIRSVHTLDRPFACLFCERTFVRKNDLKVHELTHSTQNEFICRRCGSSFRRLVYLQKHEKRCAGDGRKGARLRRDFTSHSDRRHGMSRMSYIRARRRQSKEELTLRRCRAIKEEPVDDEIAAEEFVEDKSLFAVMKEEPLEEGEICESQKNSAEDVELSSDNGRQHTSAPQNGRHHILPKSKPSKKSMLLNLFYKSSREKDSPKKSHATAYLKLPIKSVHRKKDKEADDSGAHRSPGRQPGENERVVIPKVESPDESQSLIKVIKSEPLEEGEIEEIPQRVEAVKDRLLRRNVKFEPREEAVVPKKRPIRPVSYLPPRAKTSSVPMQ